MRLLFFVLVVHCLLATPLLAFLAPTKPTTSSSIRSPAFVRIQHADDDETSVVGDGLVRLSASSSSSASVDNNHGSPSRRWKNEIAAAVLACCVMVAAAPAQAVSGGGLDYAGLDLSGQDFSQGNYKGKDFTQGALLLVRLWLTDVWRLLRIVKTAPLFIWLSWLV